jgi:hypothetical protein
MAGLRPAALALVVPVVVASLAGSAPAQPKAAAHAAAGRKPVANDAGAGGFGRAATAAAGPVVSGGSAGDAGLVEAKTLDGGAHVFKFKELDIEGRLKSPQLVYFLRRVRAEFAAEDLGHRSFMHEMSETRKEPTF